MMTKNEYQSEIPKAELCYFGGYKLVQGFRVTCLFIGQYNTKGYGTITDVVG